jgi:hypothetical protein
MTRDSIGGGLSDGIVTEFEKRLLGNQGITLQITENWGD